MKFRKVLIVPLMAGTIFLTAPVFDYSPAMAEPILQTKPSEETGYPTGATCPKTGTYRAANKHTENIIVVAKGQVFPPFSDGSKTVWYPIKEAK